LLTDESLHFLHADKRNDAGDVGFTTNPSRVTGFIISPGRRAN